MDLAAEYDLYTVDERQQQHWPDDAARWPDLRQQHVLTHQRHNVGISTLHALEVVLTECRTSGLS